MSLPDRGRPALNDLSISRGRWIDPARPDEVLASELFCEANGLGPGDRVAAIINGRRRWLTIVGIAQSPEYVYAVRAGEMIPDRRRFGILWMGRQALGAAFDMEGGFNDVAIGLARGASADATIAALDRLLAPYGGLGAIPRRLQVSAWTLDNELAQLRMFGLLDAGHLPRRRRVHPARGAHPGAVAAAGADRRVEGPRLLQPRAGVALHEVGGGDRRWPAPLLASSRGSGSAAR